MIWLKQKRLRNNSSGDCEGLYKKGSSAHDDWGDTLQEYNNIGGLNTDQGVILINAAMRFDNPEEIIYQLGKDLDQAQEIMSLSPMDMGIELAKRFSSKSNPSQDGTNDGKGLSKAPPPVTPTVDGKAKAEDNTVLNRKANMNDWIAAREAQLKAKRKTA